MTGKRPSSLAVRGLLHAEDEGRPVSGDRETTGACCWSGEVGPWP